ESEILCAQSTEIWGNVALPPFATVGPRPRLAGALGLSFMSRLSSFFGRKPDSSDDGESAVLRFSLPPDLETNPSPHRDAEPPPQTNRAPAGEGGARAGGRQRR